MKKIRFPLGLQFVPHKDKQKRLHAIVDIYVTRNTSDQVVNVEYVAEHNFMGQKVTSRHLDTEIARSLPNEALKEYL